MRHQIRRMVRGLLRIVSRNRGFRPVRNWRVIGDERSGLYVYFDPRTEQVLIKRLTSAEQCSNLESMLSVSALVEGEETANQLGLFDEQSEEVPYAF